MADLKPCPFCGAEANPEVGHAHHPMAYADGSRIECRFVECSRRFGGCMTQGPFGDSEADAMGQYEWLEVVAKSSLASLRASHAEVIRAVREWQEARTGVIVGHHRSPDRDEVWERFRDAEAALAALDLGKEGDK